MTPEQEMIERLDTTRLLSQNLQMRLQREAAAMIARLVAERDALQDAVNNQGELLTIAYMDGSHRSTQAHRETIKKLTAERDAAREELARR